MIVVADTSALIALSTCNALSLLEKLFGDILVPIAVYEECVIENKSRKKQLRAFLQNKIHNIDKSIMLDLPSNLGKGEISV